MKDGSAHPRGLDWVRSGEHGERTAPLAGQVPMVETKDDDPSQRAAVELERIADRYQEALPARNSAAAAEIGMAAHLLYVELFRDCGVEARRQKLKGAHLLWRWIEKQAASQKPTTEEIKRARAFMVQDVIEAGVSDRARAIKLAMRIAESRGIDLGKTKSYADAHDELQAGADWLSSSVGGSDLYWPITDDDIRALDRASLLPAERRQRDHLLAECAAAMPGYWSVAECVREAIRKAAHLAPYTDDPDPYIADILRIKGWAVPLFEALKLDPVVPGEKRLRKIFSAARR